MKKWLLILSLLGTIACTSSDVSTPVPVEVAGASAEPLTLCAPDLAAKQYLEYVFNASDAETHWFSEGYWQIGGNAWNQPVRGRSYFQPSVRGTRTAQLHVCDSQVCYYWATYTCGCSFYTCTFQ